MTFKGVSGFCWYLGFLFSILLLFLLASFSSGLSVGGSFFSSFFVFDYVSFYFSLISVFLLASLYGWWGLLSVRCCIMLIFSIFMSFLCYCSLNVLVFWFSYELCILPLLFLLVSESSYSERYIAFWYLLGYVVLTSLPLLLSIFYLYGSAGGFNFCLQNSFYSSWVVVFIICVCFITKIPLAPFHVWLPIVHAEASSPVSVCLSGFIMKLGILGVFRFAYLVLPYSIFSYSYVSFIFIFSIGFFMLSFQELDGKRWLAILSLCHIVLAALGLMVSSLSSEFVSFIYCLGHGISAGLVFIFLWLMYDIVGSRNWNVLKFGMGGSFLFRLLIVGSLCSVASLPTTMSFFSEVRMILDSSFYSFFIMLVFFCYLFFSGLIPLFILGGCLSRHYSVSCCNMGVSSGAGSVLVLILLCFLFFLVA